MMHQEMCYVFLFAFPRAGKGAVVLLINYLKIILIALCDIRSN